MWLYRRIDVDFEWGSYSVGVDVEVVKDHPRRVELYDLTAKADEYMPEEYWTTWDDLYIDGPEMAREVDQKVLEQFTDSVVLDLLHEAREKTLSRKVKDGIRLGRQTEDKQVQPSKA